MLERRNVTKVLETYIDLEYDTLDKAIKKLSDLKDKYHDEYPLAYLEGDSDGRIFELHGERPETDAEYKKRLGEQEFYRERQLEAARKLLRENGELT